MLDQFSKNRLLPAADGGLSVDTRDAIGLLTAPVAVFAMIVQYLIYEQNGWSRWREIIFALAIFAAISPFLLLVPFSRHGRISRECLPHLPILFSVAPIGGFVSIFLVDYRGFEPRTGVLLATLGAWNLLVFRVIVGKGQLSPISKSIRASFGTGACIGFFAGLIDLNVIEMLLGGATYGFYVFAHHWMIRSLFDESPRPVLGE